MSAWFGTSWGAPCCEPERHMPTPVGSVCPECEATVEASDQGFLVPYASRPPQVLAYHRICFLRTVIPCGMWTEEMAQNLPPRWAAHRAERHPELL